MSDKSVKRMLILLIVMGFALAGSFAVGTSYALLEDQIKDENVQTVEAGTVSVKLTEYFDSIDNKISIMKDEEGLLSDNVYDFNVKNTGTGSSLYSLYLNNDIPKDFQGKVLDNKYIKVGLEMNGEESGPYNLEEVKNVLVNKQKIEPKELISFKMRIWLDEKYKNEINNNLDAKTFLKLSATLNQDLGDNNTNLTTVK